jgi:osmotically-inducible protein OsmY
MRSIVLACAAAVALAGCAGSRSSESTGEFIDDSAITTKVKTSLLSEKGVDSTDIKVETFKGRVLLSGFVKSPDQRQRAEAVARDTGGVRAVDNRIELR